MNETLRVLHEGLSRRLLPETVARTLLTLDFVQQDRPLHAALTKASATRARSFMMDSWFEPVSPCSQIATALAIFAPYIKANPSPDIISATEKNPERIDRFIAYLSRSIIKEVGQNDFKADRDNRAMRIDHHVALSNHAYNKRFRFLARFEAKAKTYTKETRLFSYRMIGKGGLVDEITLDEFQASPAAAAFVAYYVARKNRRSIFTDQSQSRPFDALAKVLLDKCAGEPTDWSLIARVYPEKTVVARLDDLAKGKLLGKWLNVLVALSSDLESAWRDGHINLETMTVRRGNDSSTWNLMAQAWNTSRTAWMAMLAETGQQGFLTDCCPGKVLRLMAGDVAYWHHAGGSDVHPDTKVWRVLPKPWEVLRGERYCPVMMVREACEGVGIDPVKTGWVESRVATTPVAFDPTPELVHGVEVASPVFALLLRKMGVFSGKKLKLPEGA